MKQIGKILLVCVVLLPISARAQTSNIDSLVKNQYYKHHISLGVFGWRTGGSYLGGNFLGRSIFLLVCPSYDFRTPLLGKRVSFGASGSYGTAFRSNKVNNEFAVGVRALYHLPVDPLELYAGPGVIYGEKIRSNDRFVHGTRFTYFVGMRFYLRRYGFMVEFHNNRIRSLITPTIGINHRF